MIYDNIKIGKFEIFAAYSYVKALRGGMPVDKAKEHGYMLACLGARGVRPPSVPKATPKMIEKAAQPKQVSTFTVKDYDSKVAEKLSTNNFYNEQFIPVLTKLVNSGLSYEEVKAKVKIPSTRGAKITGTNFIAAVG